ncbi:hypothetical protein ACFX13_046726 [Malus domestica]
MKNILTAVAALRQPFSACAYQSHASVRISERLMHLTDTATARRSSQAHGAFHQRGSRPHSIGRAGVLNQNFIEETA